MDSLAAGEASDAPRRQRGVGKLAAALGLNRRTIYKLQERGAPATLDEAEWRAWCVGQQVRVRAALVVEPIIVPRDTPSDAPFPSKPDAPTSAGAGDAIHAAPKEGWSPTQAKTVREAELRSLQSRKTQLEIDELERRLVARDDLVRLVGALAAVFIHELVDLPAQSIRDLTELPVEWRRAVRKGIEQAIEQLRGRITSDLRRKLEQVLDGPKGAKHAG